MSPRMTPIKRLNAALSELRRFKRSFPEIPDPQTTAALDHVIPTLPRKVTPERRSRVCAAMDVVRSELGGGPLACADPHGRGVGGVARRRAPRTARRLPGDCGRVGRAGSQRDRPLALAD